MAAEPAAPAGYRVDATRSGDWWAITIVPELPGAFSQCKRLHQVDAMGPRGRRAHARHRPR